MWTCADVIKDCAEHSQFVQRTGCLSACLRLVHSDNSDLGLTLVFMSPRGLCFSVQTAAYSCVTSLPDDARRCHVLYKDVTRARQLMLMLGAGEAGAVSVS